VGPWSAQSKNDFRIIAALPWFWDAAEEYFHSLSARSARTAAKSQLSSARKRNISKVLAD
jgi:hypothetical protein